MLPFSEKRWKQILQRVAQGSQFYLYPLDGESRLVGKVLSAGARWQTAKQSTLKNEFSIQDIALNETSVFGKVFFRCCSRKVHISIH